MGKAVPQDDLPVSLAVPSSDLPDHLQSTSTWEDIKSAVTNLPEDFAVAYKSRLAGAANAFDRSLSSIGMIPNQLYEISSFPKNYVPETQREIAQYNAEKDFNLRAGLAGERKAKELKERIESRENWANPAKRNPSLLANIIGSVGALPSTIASLPLQMVEPAQIFAEQGESAGKTAAALGLGVPNAAISLISPAAYGDTLRQRIITGGGQQALQQYTFGKGFAWLADKPTTKQMFEPTKNSTAEAAIFGAGFGAATKRPSSKNTTTAAQFQDNLNKNVRPENVQPSVVPPEDIPRLLETNPGEVPSHYGYQGSPPMSPSQLKEWADRQERFKQYAEGTSEQQRYATAQAIIDARQQALEQDVARQGGLDFNAAERARQEAAPTGYDAWVEAQRQAAEQRIPGDNEPMNFNRPLTGRTKYSKGEQGNKIPEDVTLRQKQPGQENLTNEPYQYEGGIDAPELKGVPSTLPLEVQDIINRGMHEQTLPQQVLELLQTKSPEQLAKEKSLPIDILEILNTPKEPPPHAPWAKPIAGLTMGKSGRQRGVLDMSAFTEGFKGLNKWLSKLTDEPWVRQRFPASLYESNQDGTPRIMLHGSIARFNDTPKAKSLEGFHAGYAGPAHMKASIGVQEHGPQRTYLDQNKLRAGYTSNNLKYMQGENVPAHQDLGGGAIYPVVIRKGNYPHIQKTDLGSFDPSQLQNQTRFLQAVAKASNGRYGFYDVKEIMDNWWSSAKNMDDRDMILKSWSRMLKDQLGIDGFYYKNGYESANRKAQLEAERIIARRNYAGLKQPSIRASRLNVLKDKLNPSESFVTWNNNNIRSLYDEPIQPDTKGSLNKGMSRKQGGAVDAKVIKELTDMITKAARVVIDPVGLGKIIADRLKKTTGIEPGRNVIVQGDTGEKVVTNVGVRDRGNVNNANSGPLITGTLPAKGRSGLYQPRNSGSSWEPVVDVKPVEGSGPATRHTLDEVTLLGGKRGGLNQGLGGKQKGALNLSAMGLDLTESALKGRFIKEKERVIRLLSLQLKQDFPELAKVITRKDVNELLDDMREAHKASDYTQFWMEKLAGVSSKEDPTLGGQLKPLGKFMTGQAKGPKDMLDLHISEKLRMEEQQFAQIINQLYKQEFDKYSKGKLPAYVENPAEGVKWGLEHGYTDPFYHNSRMLNKEFAKNYELQTEQIKRYNNFVDKFHQHFSKKYGFDPSHFAELHPEWEQAGDHTWGLIFGLADHLQHDENSFISNRAKGIGGKQSGKVDFGGIIDEFNKLADKIKSAITKEGSTPLPKTPEDHLRNLPGMGKEGSAIIAKGRRGEDIVADTHALFDKLQAAGQPIADSKLWENFQSGAGHIAEKLRDIAPWTLELSRWYDYGKRMQQLAVRKYAQPLEKMLIKTSLDEKNQLLIAFKHGMLELGEHVPVEKLLENGMSPKAAKAYSEFIKQFDILLERKNEALRAIGEKELTKQDAYMNSLFHGDWHTFVRDKNGKMLWPVHSPTKAHAELAAKWLREHFKDNPNVDINSLEVKHSPSVKGIPRDYMGAYSKILEYFKDSEVSDQVRAALADYIKQIGSNTLGQEKFHTNVKINARGFEGDKPWLSEKVNANSFLLAQLNYIENGHTWAARQEIMNEAKKVLSDERINKEQPQAVALAKQILMQQMGISQNMFRGVETALGSKYIPSVALGKDFGISNLKDLSITQGHSAQALPNAVGTLRGAAIFAMLGFSPGYWMATPLQAINGAMGWYSKLKLEGKVKSNPVQFIGDILEGTVSAVTMKHGFSDFAKEYLDWAETNNVAHTIPFDEYRGFTMSMGMRVAKNLTNYTISRPDQLTRIPLSLSLAHAMWRSGAYETKAKAFQEAAELTNQVMIPIRREDRPLGVDKAGVVGDMSYLFASPLVAMWNTIALFGGKMEKNNPKTWLPLLTLLGAMAVMSGIHNMPVVDEAEKTGKYVANTMSEHFPKAYANLADTKWHDWAMFPKETMISNMDDHSFISQITNWGLASALTGVNMSTRFNQGVFDPNDPYGRWSPLTQEPAEWRDATLGVLHNDRHSWANAVHTMSPPLVKGLMETMLPEYKTAIQPDPSTGLTNYRNPNQPRNEDLFVQRNQEETRARMMGVTALSEAQRKSKTLYSLEEQHRRQTAIKKLMPNLWYNAVEGNQKEVVDYATAYEKLDPGGTMMSAFITEHAAKLGMTPEQVIASKAGQSIQSALTAARRARMDQGNATKP